jgi:hypothetical protein
MDERFKSSDKRRTEKITTVKKIQDALDVLVKDTDEAKKRRTVDEKKPGTQAVLDALKYVSFIWLDLQLTPQDLGRLSSCILA